MNNLRKNLKSQKVRQSIFFGKLFLIASNVNNAIYICLFYAQIKVIVNCLINKFMHLFMS